MTSRIADYVLHICERDPNFSDLVGAHLAQNDGEILAHVLLWEIETRAEELFVARPDGWDSSLERLFDHIEWALSLPAEERYMQTRGRCAD